MKIRVLILSFLAWTCAPGAPPQVTSSARALVPGTHVEFGDAQRVYVLQALEPVLVRAIDANGAPMAGAPVAVTAPTGASARALAATTDGAGRALLELRASRRAGPQTFTVTVGGNAAIGVSATAQEPARGTILTLVNARRRSGDTGHPGPGPEVALRHPSGVALDSDGTLYFSDRGTCRVYALDPSGEVASIAGTGVCTHAAVPPSVATQTPLDSPTGLAIDRVGRRLFIAETRMDHTLYESRVPSYVRVLHLDTGLTSVFAGGGTNAGPFYPYPTAPSISVPDCYTARNCHNWPVALNSATAPTNVDLFLPLDLEVGPDGALYIANAGDGYIVRVSPDGAQATYWYGQDHPFAVAPTLMLRGLDAAALTYVSSYPGVYSAIRFDAGGTPYVFGHVEALDANHNGAPGGPAWQWAVVHGPPGAATALRGNRPPFAASSLALDGLGDLHLSQHERSSITRWTPTGDVLVAGTSMGRGGVDGVPTPGDSGDYVPAAGAAIRHPGAMVVTPDGHLVFADTGNAAIRVVW